MREGGKMDVELPQVIDIYEEKIRRGWKIEDAPNEAIRKELRKRLNERR